MNHRYRIWLTTENNKKQGQYIRTGLTVMLF